MLSVIYNSWWLVLQYLQKNLLYWLTVLSALWLRFWLQRNGEGKVSKIRQALCQVLMQSLTYIEVLQQYLFYIVHMHFANDTFSFLIKTDTLVLMIFCFYLKFRSVTFMYEWLYAVFTPKEKIWLPFGGDILYMTCIFMGYCICLYLSICNSIQVNSHNCFKLVFGCIWGDARHQVDLQ